MKNRIRFTDAVLVLLGISTVLFVLKVFSVFAIVGSEPDSLVVGYFSFATAEAAILWRIYESKHKRKSKEDTAPDESDLDIDGDPNESEGCGECNETGGQG